MISKIDMLNWNTTNVWRNSVPPLPKRNLPFNACIGEKVERYNAG